MQPFRLSPLAPLSFPMPVSPPVKPDAPPSPGSAPASEARENKIVVIPESYYGVALKMQPPFASDEAQIGGAPVPPTPPAAPPPPTPAPAVPAPPPVAHHSRLWLVGLVVLVLLLAGGGWVAWNRDALFGPKVVPIIVPEKPVVPNAPTGLTAVSPAVASVRLDWQDRSETEDGFRIERKTAAEINYLPIQTLPANSLTFLDPTAPAGMRVSYQVIAFNPGGDSLPAGPTEVEVTPLPPPAPVAPTLPPDGLDLDSDGLTDTEEGTYGSNAQLPDTDSDGYLDGNEVFNLYAPTIKAPATLPGLAMMQTVSSTVGWQSLVPRVWTVEFVAGTNDARIQVPSGELFVLRVENNPSRQDLRTWLSAQKGLRADQITELSSNKYRLPFFLGPDRLTAYFPWEDKVLAVSYQLGTQTFVNYRTTFGLILNGIRFQGSPKAPDLGQPTPIPPAFQMGNATSSVSVTASTSSAFGIPLAPAASTTAVTSSMP